MRISDWSSDVCSSDLARDASAPRTRPGGHYRQYARRRSCDQRPAAEREEGQEKARRGKGDRQAEDDLDKPSEPARGFAERQRQPGDDDDDYSDDLCDRPRDRFQDMMWRFRWEERRDGKEGVDGGKCRWRANTSK